MCARAAVVAVVVMGLVVVVASRVHTHATQSKRTLLSVSRSWPCLPPPTEGARCGSSPSPRVSGAGELDPSKLRALSLARPQVSSGVMVILAHGAAKVV